MSKKMLLTLALVLGVAHVGHAAWLASTIASVYPLADGSIILTFTEPSAECRDVNQYYRITVGQNGVTEAGRKHLFATSLAAAAMSKRVAVAFDETSSTCAINRIDVPFR